MVVPEGQLAEVKAKSVTGKFPMLETPEGNLNESVAIAKYLAHSHASLLGANNVERAQIDQWCYWMISKVIPATFPLIYSIFGVREITQNESNDMSKAAKDFCREIEKHLTGDWLVGAHPTVADFCVGLLMAPLFQTVLDGGFRKAAPKASAWFERVTKLEAVIKTHGHIKSCAKGMKATIKVEEKKVAPKPAAAAKPKKDDDNEGHEEKKEKNPLDLLPESPWNFFDFKTFFVNHPDKAGAGVDELLKVFDKQGYAFWFLQYDKYKGEGEVMYKTENLLQGFLQRFDSFRKHAFARMCVTGQEPSLEIEGVWCMRGTVIPQECKDHPQFEYYKVRPLDLTNDTDVKLIREFWGGSIGTIANGRPIQSISWHK